MNLMRSLPATQQLQEAVCCRRAHNSKYYYILPGRGFNELRIKRKQRDDEIMLECLTAIEREKRKIVGEEAEGVVQREEREKRMIQKCLENHFQTLSFTSFDYDIKIEFMKGSRRPP